MAEIKLSENDRKELVKLYEEAETTPMMLVGSVCLSESAWDAVRQKMDKLGEKYRFNPKTMKGIDKKTGIVYI